MAIRMGRDTRVRVLGGNINFRFADPNILEWAKTLDHFNTSAKDFRPVFRIFAPYMIASIRRNFQQGGRPNRWPPLAPATVRERIRLGFGAGPILKRTGNLERGFWFDYGPQSMQIGNWRPYFNVHQYGYPAGNIPKRPMLVLQTSDKAYFTRLCRTHLVPE